MSASERRFLFLEASSRARGNAAALGRLAAEALPAAWPRRWIRIQDEPLPPFVDTRHAVGRAPAPDPGSKRWLALTIEATDLVVVSPLYWYGLPAQAKLYFDHWSGWLHVDGVDFLGRMKGRNLWAILVEAGEPGATGTDLLQESLRRTSGYMEMHWKGALVGHGTRPGDVWREPGIRERASRFFNDGLYG